MKGFIGLSAAAIHCLVGCMLSRFRAGTMRFRSLSAHHEISGFLATSAGSWGDTAIRGFVGHYCMRGDAIPLLR